MSNKLFVFPGNIEPEILNIANTDVPYARTEEFATKVLESERALLNLLECPEGRVVSFTASGTAAMEAAVINLVDPKDRVLVIVGGSFGQRWANMLQLHAPGQVDVSYVPFGKDIDYLHIKKLLRTGSYSMLFTQHHETSSGALFDIDYLGVICRDLGILFVVDAISSFLADTFSMQMCDVAILSSHKGLCLPPGLSFVVLGPTALKTPLRSKSTYLDFNENLKSLARGHPLFTPNVHLYLQLHKRLELVVKEVLLASVKSKAISFRSLLAHERLVPECPSACLTSFYVKCDAHKLVRALADRGFFIMPSVKENQVRVAHLGTSTLTDHFELFTQILKLEKDYE